METAETVEERVVGALQRRGWKIATAESCTGGLIGAALVNVPGASAVYSEGFITYSDEAKEKNLGVSPDTLRRYTAVSAKTAREMVRGAAERTGAQAAVASTGIAGPGGGTPQQPVGLVYLACLVNGNVRVERHIFHGGRQEVRRQAAERALEMAGEMIEPEPVPAMRATASGENCPGENGG